MFVPYRKRKALALGRREGFIEGQMDSLLLVLTVRFGQVPETFQEVLKPIQDSEKLDRLVALAATCTARDEFERVLAET
jgi:hypothetical protein